MTANDYENLGRVAYSLINGAILASLMVVVGLCIYGWYRFFKWARRSRS